jgi:hypothetical protein
MIIRIEFEVEVPDIEHTEKELEDFLRFSFRDNGYLEGSNPFIKQGQPEPIFGTFDWNYD